MKPEYFKRITRKIVLFTLDMSTVAHSRNDTGYQCLASYTFWIISTVKIILILLTSDAITITIFV